MGPNGALTNVTNVSDDARCCCDRASAPTVTMTARPTSSRSQQRQRRQCVQADRRHQPPNRRWSRPANNRPSRKAARRPTFISARPRRRRDPGQTFTSLTLTVTNVIGRGKRILSFLRPRPRADDGSTVAGVTVSVVGTTAAVTFPGAPMRAIAGAHRRSGLSEHKREPDDRPRDHDNTAGRLGRNGGQRRRHRSAGYCLDRHVHRPMSAIITGDAAGDVTEPGSADNGTPTATGTRRSTTSITRRCLAGGGGRRRPQLRNGFGTYAMTADGHWTNTLDNTNARRAGAQ